MGVDCDRPYVGGRTDAPGARADDVVLSANLSGGHLMTLPLGTTRVRPWPEKHLATVAADVLRGNAPRGAVADDPGVGMPAGGVPLISPPPLRRLVRALRGRWRREVDRLVPPPAARVDQRDARLQQLRETVAAAYSVHPSVLAELRAETLVWMAGFPEHRLARVRVHRVE